MGNQMSIVVPTGILLLNPGTPGGGSRNTDFRQISLINGSLMGPWKGGSVDLRPRQKYIDLAKKFDNIFDLANNSSKYFDLASNTRLHFLAKLSLILAR